MFNGKFRVIAIYLAGALTVFVLSSTPLRAQEIVLIFGTGFKPHDLREGSRPMKGAWIQADSKTIVVLKRAWPLKEGRCEDWVILRGRQYQVETSTPGNCPKRGRGDEVARAMNGESMVAHLTLPVLGFDAPKADSLLPEELQMLQSDLYRLKEKNEEEVPPPRDHRLRGGTKAYGGATREKAWRFPPRQAPRVNTAPPASRKTGELVSSSFRSQRIGSTWFVAGVVKNISGRHLACVRLRFNMSTSFQDKQRGAPNLDLGVMEVEVRDLAVGERRPYRQALTTRVGLGSAPAEECK